MVNLAHYFLYLAFFLTSRSTKIFFGLPLLLLYSWYLKFFFGTGNISSDFYLLALLLDLRWLRTIAKSCNGFYNFWTYYWILHNSKTYSYYISSTTTISHKSQSHFFKSSFLTRFTLPECLSNKLIC